MLGVLSVLRKALVAALMCGALATATTAHADDGSGVTLIWRGVPAEASEPRLGACPSSFVAPGSSGLWHLHTFSTLGAYERQGVDAIAAENADSAEGADWRGGLAATGAGPMAKAADGQERDPGEDHGEDVPWSGSDPASKIDLGSLDDAGEDDFSSSAEDVLFHAHLYLVGLRWVERALPDAIEPSAGYSRIVDGRCDRPPRV